MRIRAGRLVVVVMIAAGVTLALPGPDTVRATGHVKWRFKVTSNEYIQTYIQARPAVGPDGSVYFVASTGILYALTPEGALKWTFTGAAWDSGVDVDSDGTIYTANPAAVFALRPNGTIKWQFAVDPTARSIFGPNLGPDGNIYLYADESLGLFSLTPRGRLRWHVDDPLGRAEVTIEEIMFGPAGTGHQVYSHADRQIVGTRLSGNVRFRRPGGTSRTCSNPQPAVGRNGQLYVLTGTDGNISLNAIRPNGELRGQFFQFANCATAPDVGPDNTVYVGYNLATLLAFRPDGTERWRFRENSILHDPIVSPLNDLVFIGGQYGYGEQGFFLAVTTAGSFGWRIELPFENGSWIYPFSRARFTPDGRVAYIGTAMPASDIRNDYAYLYAVEAAP